MHGKTRKVPQDQIEMLIMLSTMETVNVLYDDDREKFT